MFWMEEKSHAARQQNYGGKPEHNEAVRLSGRRTSRRILEILVQTVDVKVCSLLGVTEM